MDSLTLNLANFALNMHTIKQNVASKNIASAGLQNKLEVDFSQILNDLDTLSEPQKITYLNQLNQQGLGLSESLEKDTGEAVSIESEHAASTTAMLEYQALIEAINRKMAISSAVLGGQR